MPLFGSHKNHNAAGNATSGTGTGLTGNDPNYQTAGHTTQTGASLDPNDHTRGRGINNRPNAGLTGSNNNNNNAGYGAQGQNTDPNNSIRGGNGGVSNLAGSGVGVHNQSAYPNVAAGPTGGGTGGLSGTQYGQGANANTHDHHHNPNQGGNVGGIGQGDGSVHSSALRAQGEAKELEAAQLKRQGAELEEAERLERDAQTLRQNAVGHGAHPSHGRAGGI